MPLIPKLGDKGTVIGLDIGTDSIKLVELRRAKTGIELLNMGIIPTPVDTVTNKVINDPITVGDSIRQLIATLGVTSKRVVSAVNGQTSLVVRITEYPEMAEHELAETVKWDLDRLAPFDIARAMVDFKPLPRLEGLVTTQDNVPVLIAVAEGTMIDNHVQTLMHAGLDPIAIDLEALAAARSLIQLTAQPEDITKSTVIINMGDNLTDISIHRGSTMVFPRVIGVAGATLTKAIADDLGVDLKEADQLKKEKAEIITEPTAPEIDATKKNLHNSIIPIIENLITEIKRSIDYYISRARGVAIDKVVLAGGSAKLKNFDKHLFNALGTEVVMGYPFQNVLINPQRFTKGYLQELAPLMSVSMGLALREFMD